MTTKFLSTLAVLLGVSFVAIAQKKYSPKQIEALKTEVAQVVEANHKQSQVAEFLEFPRPGLPPGPMVQDPL